MKTIKMLTAALLIALTLNVFADDKPGKKYIKPAQYVLIVADGSPVANTVKFKNPQAIVEEGLTEEAFKIGYPEVNFGQPEEVDFGSDASTSTPVFKNPEAIVEYGLTEAAFKVGFPEMVWGSPEDLRTVSIGVKKANVTWKNAEAITENGIDARVFEIGYPQFVWGDPSDVNVKEAERLAVTGK